ncbi:helix-turn-helix transcriptional regulator [Chiayiivirga flava]|uniref:AraC family transcriptional regulator n=1 Tax=Chiayiivirga flava TaxID=659595 RepID=A0A7W8G0X8_9GAMM|nr:helix-turn-helix transcriptional regulator [Chiayiivirga flava]MBB5208253.1 AraC family transcriptional regulator [Chiayiivirga flava]
MPASLALDPTESTTRALAAPPPGPNALASGPSIPPSMLLSLHDNLGRLPELPDHATLWICLRGAFAIDSRDGPFLLTGRHYLTLPCDYRASVLPGYDGVGLLVAVPQAAFGRAVFALQPRRGLQRMPYALCSRAPASLIASTFACLRHAATWEPQWRAFQALQLMHAALAAQSEIAGWLARAPGRTEKHRHMALQRLLHARNRILNAPFDEHDMDSLAQAARYSKSHFIKAFRDVFGETPGALHVAARIEMAKLLIARSGLSIGEIAADLGYGSRCAFSRSFKLHTGINATVFRREGERRSGAQLAMAGA